MYIRNEFKPTIGNTKGYSKETKEIINDDNYKNYTYIYYITNWNTLANGLEYILGSYSTTYSKYAFIDKETNTLTYLTANASKNQSADAEDYYGFNDIVNGDKISPIKKNYLRNLKFVIDITEENIPVEEINLMLVDFDSLFDLGNLIFEFKHTYTKPINVFINNIYQNVDIYCNKNTIRLISIGKRDAEQAYDDLIYNVSSTNEYLQNNSADLVFQILGQSLPVVNTIKIYDAILSNKEQIIESSIVKFLNTLYNNNASTIFISDSELTIDSVEGEANLIICPTDSKNIIKINDEDSKNKIDIIGKFSDSITK